MRPSKRLLNDCIVFLLFLLWRSYPSLPLLASCRHRTGSPPAICNRCRRAAIGAPAFGAPIFPAVPTITHPYPPLLSGRTHLFPPSPGLTWTYPVAVPILPTITRLYPLAVPTRAHDYPPLPTRRTRPLYPPLRSLTHPPHSQCRELGVIHIRML